MRLLKIRDEGALADFAIGGGHSSKFYTPAVVTEDLDISASLTPLYARLQALGGVIKNEHPVIGKWLVHIVPAYTPLIQEAVTQAVGRTFDGQGCRCKLFMRCCAVALFLF